MHISRITVLVAVLALFGCSEDADNTSTETSAGAGDSATIGCDRDCINGITEDYLAALLAHNPDAAPLADNIVFVENVTRMLPGEGLWQSAVSGPTDFAVYIPDTDLQQAGFMGVMERQGANGTESILLALRLKLDGEEIVEAEHLVSGVTDMEHLTTLRSGLASEVPEASRISHDELARIGLSYYDALDDNDGSLMPFSDDCQRHENGMVTAGPEAGGGPNADPDHPVASLCAPQLDSQSFVYIEDIENRRLIAADPVTGLAIGFSHFRHSFENLPYDVVSIDGTTIERNADNMPYGPFDMPAAHIFKVGADGRVHEIEALGVLGVPYMEATGWENTDADFCDRACVLNIGEEYVAAIVAHDPSAAALANDIAFVENVTAMSPGEGLWQSVASAPDDFAIYVPDAVNQTVGFIGVMTYMAAAPPPQGSSPEERAEWAATAEQSEQPVIVAIRLKLKDGEVVEAEHLLAGIRPTEIGTLQTPRPGLLTDISAENRLGHSNMITLGAAYYDALDDNDGSLMPFAADCERHENGMITASGSGNAGAGPNNVGAGVARACGPQLDSKTFIYIDRIENRRVFAADPVTGLVMGLSHFRHSMSPETSSYEVINTDGSTALREVDFAPFDLPAGHIFKFGEDGQVHEIEAMGFTTTYNAPTGWE